MTSGGWQLTVCDYIFDTSQPNKPSLMDPLSPYLLRPDDSNADMDSSLGGNDAGWVGYCPEG
jgi:hypothetical protein